MAVSENINTIRLNLAAAAKKSDRELSDITIIAVTKYVDVEQTIEVSKCGINSFGESRVQELCRKYEKMGSGYNWHFIGRLQKNKVKYIVDKVALIHSIDSIEIINELDKRAEWIKKTVNILIQVNVSGEQSKQGIAINGLEDIMAKMTNYRNVKVMGLMTMAPFVENPEDARWVFKKLKLKFEQIKKLNFDNIEMKYLSMGMSNDYEVAVEEGANLVRIGRILFK